MDRFDLYGALWKFCADFHSGQTSRGYRILSRLSKAGYQPSYSLQAGQFESIEQEDIYNHLVEKYYDDV